MRNKWISLYITKTIRKQIYKICVYIKDELKKNNIIFEPMLENNLHMTLVFLGEKTDEKKINIEIDNFKKESYKLNFEKVINFPPYKENLLVIIFDENMKLLNKVNDMKKELNIKDIFSFVPHITLGKIVCHKLGSNKEIIDNIINNVNKMMVDILKDFKSNECYLCGAN